MQDPHQLTNSDAVAQELLRKEIDAQKQKGQTSKFQAGVLRFRAILWIGALPVHAAAPDASLGDNAQHQAWDILQAGVTDKSAPRRTQAVLALGLLPGNQKAVDVAEAALDDNEPAERARCCNGARTDEFHKLHSKTEESTFG